jgi:hypothetical protein
MATAKEYAQWLVDNEGLAGTQDFNTVATAYQRAKLEEQEIAAASNREGSFIPEAGKALTAGLANVLESGLYGASFLLPEEQEQAARGAITRGGAAIQEALAPAADYEGTITRNLLEGIGSTGPFLLAGAGLPGFIAATGLAASAGAGEAAQRAEAAGATEEEISRAAALGTLPGLGEIVVPGAITRTVRTARQAARAARATENALESALGPEVATDVISRLRRIGMAAGGEGLQEASAQVAQNLIAQKVYDPESGLFTGTGESLGYGAGVGGIIEAIAELVAIRGRQRGATRGELTTAEEEGLGLNEQRAPAYCCSCCHYCCSCCHYCCSCCHYCCSCCHYCCSCCQLLLLLPFLKAKAI